MSECKISDRWKSLIALKKADVMEGFENNISIIRLK